MKVKVQNKVIDIDECYIQVVDGRLKNFNTGCDEGIEGDEVEYKHGKDHYKGHVVGYTNYQLVETEEWGRVILGANEARFAKYTHKNKVEKL